MNSKIIRALTEKELEALKQSNNWTERIKPRQDKARSNRVDYPKSKAEENR